MSAISVNYYYSSVRIGGNHSRCFVALTTLESHLKGKKGNPGTDCLAAQVTGAKQDSVCVDCETENEESAVSGKCHNISRRKQ